MKQCDTCGGPLAEGHPYTLCPKCLFGEAMGSRPHSPWRGDGGGDEDRLNFHDKYDLLEKVGEGGQGDVWKAWDMEFRRCVAMKRIAETAARNPAAVQRFLAEAQIASQLEHPGVLPVFDLGFDPEGRAYYTTQLLPGTTLEAIWRQHAEAGAGAGTARELALLLRVCEVMAYAHSRGVIHRDLKPANILVGAFGDVRVVDWGSAHVLPSARRNFAEALAAPALAAPAFAAVETDRGRAIADHPASPLATASSGQPVTLLFTPPEIIGGDADALGAATDIYALGVMLYQLLTGRTPYCPAGGGMPGRAELKHAILAGAPAPVGSVNRGASRDLAAICEKAMARDRAARYATMEELADDLRAALENRPVQARRPGLILKLQKWSQRNFSHVLLAGGALLLLSVVLSSALGFKAQRDAARQASLVRNAELAARGGHWREAIRDWDAAAAAGYPDAIDLNLQKAEAWTILSEPAQAGALLKGLAARPDLGRRRGLVLLRLGEYELSDRQNFQHGMQLVREAMAAGLTDADLLFARGLLADNTPEALDWFQQALQHDPYHLGAHRNSLGLEFLLGRHEQMANHIAILKTLYPDDPTPGTMVAAEAAMAGDGGKAQAELEGMRGWVNSNSWAQAAEACQAYAAAAKFYDVDALLGAGPNARTPLDKLRTDPFSAGVMLMPGDFTGITNRLNLRENLRLPRLPSIQQGTLAAGDGLRRLAQPYLANPLIAIQEIEAGWHHHPEGLIPALGGMLLENQQPPNSPPVAAITQLQAQLYQMAADSPSMMPSLGRLARYLAARSELELATNQTLRSQSAATNCLADVRAALACPETSGAEGRAYFEIAMNLGDQDLALRWVDFLEARQPADEFTRRSRIRVEIAQGALGPALESLNQLLAADAGDPWALAQQRRVLSALKALAKSAPINP
jgi:serine/threonine protein kinase